MNITIETNIPLPQRVGGRLKGSKYPFAQMQPGDSFLVPSDVKPSTLRAAVSAFSKKAEAPVKKFAIRVVDNGVRVWCTGVES